MKCDLGYWLSIDFFNRIQKCHESGSTHQYMYIIWYWINKESFMQYIFTKKTNISFKLFYDSFFFCIFNRNRKTCFGSTQDILELRTWFQLMHHYDTINGIYKYMSKTCSQIYFIIFLIKWKYSWNENQEMLLIYG